jgi:tRNA U38,U39,U40 pseudouridine synthase TruA
VSVPQGWRYDIAQQCHELPPLINHHLPPHLRVFSAAPVERYLPFNRTLLFSFSLLSSTSLIDCSLPHWRSFRARARCIRREYEYWFPRTLLEVRKFFWILLRTSKDEIHYLFLFFFLLLFVDEFFV